MKLILQGYTGKMGSVVYEYLLSQNEEFIGLFDEKNHSDENLIPLCDALIDFSTIESAKKLFNLAVKYHKPIIIGTTGFNELDIKNFEKKAIESNIGVYVVANFLESMSILEETISKLAINSDQVYVSETHHNSKKDLLSGTAKMLVKNVNPHKCHFIAKRVNYFTYEHDIQLINEFESIEIVHKCYNKLGYAKGVKKALENLNFVGLRQSIS